MSDQWKRLAGGGVLAVLALAGLIWTGLCFSTEYRFRRLTAEAKATGLSHTQLVTLSMQLQRLTRSDPTNGEIRNLYASILGRLGDYEPAVRELQVARKTLSTRNTLFFLADMYQKLGRIPDAEAAMADCLRINPTDVEFNPGLLYLLGQRVYELNVQKDKLKDLTPYHEYRRRFAEATLNWAIRAANDKNAFLFLGNLYMMDPLYAQQSYRCFLMGLSGAPWLNLNERMMMPREMAMGTLRSLVTHQLAKPYKGMP